MMKPAFVLAAILLAVSPALGAPAKKKTSGAEGFIQLPHMSATLTDGMNVAGLLQVDAGLDIADAKLRAKAERLMPRLRHAYSMNLTRYAHNYHRPGGVPDADRIADMLQSATDEVLQDDSAVLLLTNVMISVQ